MMIRKTIFPIQQNEAKKKKKVVKGMHLMARARKKHLSTFPSYWSLLNCQRSIFLTVPLFFCRAPSIQHSTTHREFYRAMPNANKTIVRIPLSVGIHTLFSPQPSSSISLDASAFAVRCQMEKFHQSSRVYWFIFIQLLPCRALLFWLRERNHEHSIVFGKRFLFPSFFFCLTV